MPSVERERRIHDANRKARRDLRKHRPTRTRYPRWINLTAGALVASIVASIVAAAIEQALR
ncbi:hypothetical protein [Micromonospora sp. NPDC023633]|uniref:hypothetical protein n=1 Tax=Micromonospora sp. NPDC023633 TaxID=3154320 RepID=UPI0033DBC2BD